MIVICIVFVPVFNKLKVYTAYEFLENRFDLKTQNTYFISFPGIRGLSTGISIYAPSIILSSLLGWNIYYHQYYYGWHADHLYSYWRSKSSSSYTKTAIDDCYCWNGYCRISCCAFNASMLVCWMLYTLAAKNGKMNIITSGEMTKALTGKTNTISGVELLVDFFSRFLILELTKAR